jgi:septal ring factor EnvC (AmiA/AmiB activator)
MAESMLAANPILKQQLPKPSGNVGIGYAQGALNIGTQNKATESLNVEKAEGEISQTSLNAAKAELAKQQGILSTKTAERTSKQQEKAAKEQERAEAQRRVEEANRRLAEARAAAERARAEAEAKAAAARAAASQPQASYTPAQTYIPPAPVYTPPPTPAPAPVAAAAPLPSYVATFGDNRPRDSGSASSAMRAAMGKVYQKPTKEEMEREARAAEWFMNQASMI